MSATVTSSPSPTASPHPAFHPPPAALSSSWAPSQRSSPVLHQRPSPRLFPAANSPRRPFHSPASSTSVYQHPKQHHPDSALAAGTFVRYTSRGTQYSPDGYPPTSRNKVAADAGKQPGSTASSSSSSNGSSNTSSARKRKEAAYTASMSSGAGASSGALSQSQRQHSEAQPHEPSVGSEPGPSSRTNNQSTPADPEPQEARSTHGHSAAPKRSRPEGSLKLMPFKYEHCDPKDLGHLISNMLMELIRINDRIPLRDGRLTRFHSRAPPGISVSDYLQRLIQHATLSPPILLSMVYYIDRLCTLYPAFTINSLTVHRFLITAATVAAKGLSDSFWTNPTYARIGGIPVSELATLEMEFLQRVHWKIVPKPEVLDEYYASLVERTDGYAIDGARSSASDSTSVDESDGANNPGDEKIKDANDDAKESTEPT